MNAYQMANPDKSDEKKEYEASSEEAIIAARMSTAVTIKTEGQPNATGGNAATIGEAQVIYVRPHPHGSLPKMKLRNGINSILTQLRIRERKGVDENYIWWQKIIEKFNRSIRLMVLQKHVEAKSDEKKFSVEEVMNTLDIATKVDELDSSSRAKEESERKRNDPSDGNRFNRNSNQKNGYQQFNGSRQQKKPKKQTNADDRSTDAQETKQCSFCSRANHPSHECKAYSTSEIRVKRLEELKKCTKCASPIHVTKDCRFRGKCYRCKNNGHYQFRCRSKVTDQKPNQMNKRATNLSRKWTRASHAHTLRHLAALTPWRHSLKNKSGQISPSGFFSDIHSQTFCDLLFCDIRRQEYIYSFITQKYLVFAWPHNLAPIWTFPIFNEVNGELSKLWILIKDVRTIYRITLAIKINLLNTILFI